MSKGYGKETLNSSMLENIGTRDGMVSTLSGFQIQAHSPAHMRELMGTVG